MADLEKKTGQQSKKAPQQKAEKPPSKKKGAWAGRKSPQKKSDRQREVAWAKDGEVQPAKAQRGGRVAKREERRPEIGAEAATRGIGYGEAELGLAPPPSAVAAVAAARAPRRPGRLVSAWYASYSDPATVALLQRDPSLRDIIAETVFQDDDRKQILDTDDFPWRCLCWLVITAETGHQFIGTGWLSGPRTVITAGHCVYLHKYGGWARAIDVYQGHNGSNYLALFTSEDLHTTAGFIDDRTPEDDYGAILLPQAPGDFLGYEAADEATLTNLLVNVTGYPSDKPEATLWGNTRRLKGADGRQLFYTISTAGGNSGGPVFYKEGEKRWVVGIHNYGGGSYNMATRITDQVFDDIEAWTR